MCKILIRRKKKGEIVQIINLRVDGGETKNNKHKTTNNINSEQRIREDCKKIQERRRGCTKYSHTDGVGDAVQNIHTQWSRGCCTKQSNTMEQRKLYKIITHNRAWDAVQNIRTRWSRGCCRKY
jgi:hypothetical protein